MNENILKYLPVILLLNGLNAWRSFVIEFARYQYELNPDYIRSYDVKLVEDKGLNVINGTVCFTKDIHSLMVYFDVIVPRPGNDWTLINVTLDGCKELEASAENSLNLPHIILEELRKSKKFFPKKCPIQKDKTIYIENMYLDPEKFPPYMPDMSFKATLILSENNEMIIKSLTTGSVQSKRAMRKDRRKNIPNNKTAS